jgi:hypothetical protein
MDIDCLFVLFLLNSYSFGRPTLFPWDFRCFYTLILCTNGCRPQILPTYVIYPSNRVLGLLCLILLLLCLILGFLLWNRCLVYYGLISYARLANSYPPLSPYNTTLFLIL